MTRSLKVRWLGVATLVAASIYPVASVLRRFARPAPDPYVRAVAPLVEAVGARRFTEARLSGGFRDGPLVGATRAATESAFNDDWHVLAAAAEVHERLERTPSPENRHAFAVAQLLLGQRGDALQRLESLSSERPHDCALVNDLAAGYLMHAEADGAAEDLPRALDLALRASDRRECHDQAASNVRLALDRLHLQGERASPALSAASVTPSEPVPAGPAQLQGDARRALAARDGPWLESLLDVSVPAVVDLLQDQLSEATGAAAGGPRPAAIETATWLAEALAARTGDRSWLEVTRSLGLPDARPRVLARTFFAGRAALRQNRWQDATALFVRARATGGALGLWAELATAQIEFQDARMDAAVARLQSVEPRARAQGFRLAEARCLWLRATALASVGRYDQGLAAYTQAIDAYARAGDEESAATVRNLRAETLDLLGERPRAWQDRLVGLARAPRMAEARRRLVVYRLAGTFSAEDGWDRAADAFFREGQRYVPAAAFPPEHGSLLIERARIAERLAPGSGRPLLEAARPLIDAASDPILRTRLGSQVDLAMAEILARDDRAAAASALRRAEIVLERRGRGARSLIVPVYAQWAWLDADGGRLDQADRLVEQAMQLVREQGRLGLGLQTRFSEQLDGLVRLGVALDLRRGVPASAALQRVESAYRTEQTLLGAAQPEESTGDSFSHVPPQTAAWVAYPTADTLVVWTVEGGRVGLERIDVGEAELERLGRDMSEAALHSPRAFQEAGARAWAVVGPSIQRLLPRERVVFVTRGALAAWPLAGLWDGSRYLVEKVAIQHAPALAAVRPEEPVAAPPVRRALVVGDPLRSDAPPLPGARREAARIAALYPESELLLREAAALDVVSEQLSRADVVHFGAHGRLGGRRPELSRLLLAERPGAASDLFARDVFGLRTHARAVVLAACNSATTRAGSAGLTTLVDAFLAAGARSVVASLWQVDDTTDVFYELHYSLRSERDAALALQAVQRAAIHSRTSDADPRRWAGLVVFGS